VIPAALEICNIPPARVVGAFLFYVIVLSDDKAVITNEELFDNEDAPTTAVDAVSNDKCSSCSSGCASGQAQLRCHNLRDPKLCEIIPFSAGSAKNREMWKKCATALARLHLVEKPPNEKLVDFGERL